MLVFVGKRLAGSIFALAGVSLLTFLSIHLTPGDPVLLMVSPQATEQQIQAIRVELGLDKPIPLQYLIWLGRVVRGDLGRSLYSRIPVRELIADRLPSTLTLAASAFVVTIAISLPVGLLSAARRDTILDIAASTTTLLFVSIPSFWLGMILILIFGLYLGWLPVSGYVSPWENAFEWGRHLVLPVISLAFYETAWLVRTIRSGILEILNQEYIRTARAKGLKGSSVLLKHALKNALLPVITVLGLQFGYLLAGAVVIEEVFAWPGLGRLLVTDGIYRRDFVVIQGCVLLIASGFVIANAISDFCYALVDPRVKYE